MALLFAGDRADAAQTIRTWLAEGRAVVLDRYVWSNVAYQCARLRGGDCERRRLRDWILDLEYGRNAIPRPDVSLFLDVPFAFVERKLAEQREGADRSYLRGAQDIYESSLALQRAVRGVYLDAAASDAGVRLVDCSDAAGGMAPPECVFDRISTILEPVVVRPRPNPTQDCETSAHRLGHMPRRPGCDIHRVGLHEDHRPVGHGDQDRRIPLDLRLRPLRAGPS